MGDADLGSAAVLAEGNAIFHRGAALMAGMIHRGPRYSRSAEARNLRNYMVWLSPWVST